MDAKELVAAIRAEHFNGQILWEGYCRKCTTGTGDVPWPCPPAIAANRIEKMLARMDIEIDAGGLVENVGKGEAPASMLRVYVRAEANGEEP